MNELIDALERLVKLRKQAEGQEMIASIQKAVDVIVERLKSEPLKSTPSYPWITPSLPPVNPVVPLPTFPDNVKTPEPYTYGPTVTCKIEENCKGAISSNK